METNQTEYFTSYEDLEVHKLMLEDSVRTLAYKDAILKHSSYFKDKIVMDVGCGTGILSIFCAQAGAKKVYAIEASNVANLAKEVVKENNFEDIIEVFHSRVEDLDLPGVKVDAIVSEWMGFYLLHEAMLDSVFAAREKFLKEDGLMFPKTAIVYMAPCSLPQYYKQWNNIYDVKMTKFGEQLRLTKREKPEIMTIEPIDLLGPETELGFINLQEDNAEDVKLCSMVQVTGAIRSGEFQGVCLWFKCLFPHLNVNEPQIVLDTSPHCTPTHWKQTVIVLPNEQTLEANQPIAYQVDLNRDTEEVRRYHIKVTLLDPEEIDHPIPCNCDMTKCIVIATFLTQHPGRKEYNADIIKERKINK